MKLKSNRFCALVLTLLLTWSLAVPASAQETSATLQTAADTAALYALQYGGAQSLQYALWKDGEVVLTGTAGTFSRTEEYAMTGSELYGIGSVSKIFTTVAVMRLAEQKKISLDAPVVQYLPEFKMADARYRDITVRMLLNHSSGIMGSGLGNALLFGEVSDAATDGLLDVLSTQRLVSAPGAYSVYCNDGFTLAELVVEAVSGREFMDFVEQEILAPAKLKNIYAPAQIPDDALLAQIYSGDDPRALPADYLGVTGAGGIYATASDLAAFGGALTGTDILTRSSLDAMAYPEYSRGIWPEDTLDAMAYGLGWDNVEWYPFCQSNMQALVKGGDTLYFHSGLIILPEYDMAAAVVSSGGASIYNELAATQMLIAALAEDGVTVDQSIPAVSAAQPAAMPAEAMKYAGYYGATTAQYRISLSQDGVMTMRYMNYPSTIPDQSFTYCSDGTFRDATGTAILQFVEEENGQTYLYQKAISPIPGLGALPASNYAAVKLADNPLSGETAAAWDTILRMDIVPMNEVYNSQVYLALATSSSDDAAEAVPGYIGSVRITDANTALYEVQLPGGGGRDGMDYHVSNQNGVTWIRSYDRVYMDSSAVPVLYTGSGHSYTTIQSDGYARWYQVGRAAGKTMTVTVPETAGFWVYDGDGQLTASSVLWGDISAVLPDDGLIVFAGDIGERFHLRFQ